jgi:hypothetical protein
MTINSASAGEVAQRLLEATNRHDLDSLVSCFAPDFVNETPAHPSRSFVGAEQVRRNWGQIFAGVPDLHAAILGSSIDGDSIWTEWEMKGTRLDGSAHLMRGVGIFAAEGGRFKSLRFYLEPVEVGGADADRAVHEQVTR